MLRSLRHLPWLSCVVALAAVNLLGAQLAWGFTVTRIIPSGKVKVYQGDRVVQVLSEEAPFPNGMMLENEGQCGARFENFYMVAIDQSRFGVREAAGERRLVIDRGTVYFAFSSLPGRLVFETPAGEFPAENILIYASSNGGLLRGYVTATPDKTEIGVLDGGAMVVSTFDGNRKIDSGRQITIAQAQIVDENADQAGAAGANGNNQEQAQGEAAQDDDDDIPVTYYVVGGVAAAAVVGGAIALSNGGSGGGSGGGGGGGNTVSPVN
jgi:hypothetical protein